MKVEADGAAAGEGRNAGRRGPGCSRPANRARCPSPCPAACSRSYTPEPPPFPASPPPRGPPRAQAFGPEPPSCPGGRVPAPTHHTQPGLAQRVTWEPGQDELLLQANTNCPWAPSLTSSENSSMTKATAVLWDTKDCAPKGLQARPQGQGPRPPETPPTGDPAHRRPWTDKPCGPITALGAAAPPSGSLLRGTDSRKREVVGTQAAQPLGGAHRNLGAPPRPETPLSAPSLTPNFQEERARAEKGAGAEQRGRPRPGWRLAAPHTRAPASTCQVSLPGPSPSTGASPPFDLEACITAQDTEAAASPPSGSCVGRQGAKAGAVSAVSPAPGVLGEARGRAGLLAPAARPSVAREGPSVTLWGAGRCLHTGPR